MSKDQAITKSTIQLWVIIKPKIPATSLKVVATITMFQKKCSVILDHAEPLLETGKKIHSAALWKNQNHQKKQKKWNQLGSQPRLCGLRVVPSGFLHPVAALPGANWLQVSALLKAALVTRASVLTRREAQEVLR